jgi:threonine dehydratase
MPLGLPQIRAAAEAIRTAVDRTPVVWSRSLSRRAGVNVTLKLENLQRTGSFKVRGAFARMSQLTAAERRRGVVTASAGNHAQGVALAAATLGVASTIIMPEVSSIPKQEASRSYGASVLIGGKDLDEAMARARMIERNERKVFIHPFDDDAVIAGQGSVGLEILEDRPDIGTIVVPIGGGGLAAGIALAAKTLKPRIHVVGVTAPARPTLADGIAVKGPSRRTRRLIDRYVDRCVAVAEEEIAEAILLLMEHKRIIAEGAGAAALAALLNHGRNWRGPVCLVVSGGNIDVSLLDRIIERGLARSGRLLRLSVPLLDRPGALAGLSAAVGQLGANILHIVHDRLARDLPITQSRVLLSLETRGGAHNKMIIADLRRRGYRLLPISD